VIAELMAWDGRMSADSRAAVLFDALLTELAKMLVWERLPEELAPDIEAIRMLESWEVNWPEILDNPASRMWTQVRLGPDEAGPPGRRTAMAVALARAASNAPAGEWGAVNRYDIQHSLGAFLPGLSAWLTLPPAPAPGGLTTICKNTGPPPSGPSLRLIVDLARPGEISIILPTGQSGRPESPNSRDQYALWLRGDYLTVPGPVRPDDTIIELVPN
jgi:penicillin amidase